MSGGRYRFVTVDVFASERYAGNPLAVLPEAAGLDEAAMQRIAREFNLSETAFVLPPEEPGHGARVRIFTPTREMPFAGHPNIGTGFVLAAEMAARGEAVPEVLLFEEIAGLVPVRPLLEGGVVAGASLEAPQALSRLGGCGAAEVAACLSLRAEDVVVTGHAPQVVSVGAPFLVAELAGLEALGRVRPDPVAWGGTLPRDGASSIYAYVRLAEGGLRSRMFTRELYEDPATGSATATVAALLLDLSGEERLSLTVRQGVEMGRASLLRARAWREGGAVRAGVAGDCAKVMEGWLRG